LPRFNRTYRFVIGEAGAMGDEVKPPIHVTFDVTKDTNESPNNATIRVYNLAEKTRMAWQEPDKVAMLYAGYTQEQSGDTLLFSGNVVEAWTKFDKADVITEVFIADGYVPMRETTVSLSYGKGARASEIITDIAKQMNLPLLMGNVPDRTWSHGFSFYGSAHDALHKVVRGTGLEWSIQNGRLQVIEDGKTNEKPIYVLNADSGLISTPERTRKGAQEKAQVKDKKTGDDKRIVSSRQQKDGWRVTSLLLPYVEPGDQIKLESRSVEGVFRIDSVRHTGDYGGSGEWVSELEVVE